MNSAEEHGVGKVETREAVMEGCCDGGMHVLWFMKPEGKQEERDGSETDCGNHSHTNGAASGEIWGSAPCSWTL